MSGTRLWRALSFLPSPARSTREKRDMGPESTGGAGLPDRNVAAPLRAFTATPAEGPRSAEGVHGHAGRALRPIANAYIAPVGVPPESARRRTPPWEPLPD